MAWDSKSVDLEKTALPGHRHCGASTVVPLDAWKTWPVLLAARGNAVGPKVLEPSEASDARGVRRDAADEMLEDDPVFRS